MSLNFAPAFRNDYPDEEDYENFVIDPDGELSDFDDLNLNDDYGEEGDESDDETGLVYSKAFDQDDANRHGTSYAKYKQRMMRNLYEEEDEDLEYKSEDDD